MQSSSIMVVDDNPINFDVIASFLLQEGYNLTYVSSGAEALNQICQCPPDLVLLDVMMPEIDGLMVCQQLKSNPRCNAIPIIMVTTLIAKADLARCIEAGADDFLSKPVNGIELRARVRSMLRIKHQHDRLESMLQMREDMTNMIVHDLRNPLASIFLSCDILTSCDLAENPLGKVHQIVSAAEQLRLLVDDVLILGKLEAGKLLLNLVPVEINSLLESAIYDFQAIAEPKNIHIHYDFPPTNTTQCLDAHLIRRTIDNLLSNAIKFSPPGGIVSVKLTLNPLQITVGDQGPGISPEKRAVIFEKYSSYDFISGVTQIGLGLSFCKMILEAHGGTISVADNFPQGTIFTLSLPDTGQF